MRVFFLIFLPLFLNATSIQIIADKFEANEKLGIGTFLGNVLVKKEQDTLKANKLVIRFDKKKNPILYETQGDTSVKTSIDDKHYFGKAKKISFDPIKNTYILDGDAFLEDISTKKKIYGDKIIVDQKNGEYLVDGNNQKPVKFIFELKNDKNP